MATGISSPLALGGLFPSVDGGYVAANGKPFTSVSNAESALNGFPSKLSESCVGLTVLVKESGWPKAKEYWVQPKGTTPETYGLVEKGAGVTDYNDLDNKPTISDGVNTALPIVGNVKVSAATASGDTAGVSITPGQNAGEIEMQFTLPKGNDAYEVYLEKYKEEHSGSTDGVMSKDAWLASLKGADGADGQDGAPGHNPCLGRFPAVPNPMPNGQIGDYLYVDITTVDPNTQEETTTTTVYHYGINGWDNGTAIDAEHPTFASSQPVTAVHIKDENGDDVSESADVLSAEAGANLFQKDIKTDREIELLRDGMADLNLDFDLDGRWLDASGNVHLGGNTRKVTSKFYPVFAGDVVKASFYAASGDCYAAFYDSQKVFVRTYNNTSQTISPKYITINVEQDGFLRFTNFFSYQSSPDAYVYKEGANVEELNQKVSEDREIIEDLTLYHSVVCDVSQTERGLLGAATGLPVATAQSTNYRYCPTYFYVHGRTSILAKAYSTGTGAGICFYDENKDFLSKINGASASIVEYSVPSGAYYVRICTEYYPTRGLYLELPAVVKEDDGTGVQKSFKKDYDTWIVGESATEFKAKTQLIERKYNGQVSPSKRFVAIGFDDFRDSDFSFIIPLFNKYGARAVFNRVHRSGTPSKDDISKVYQVIYGGHEVGDHTFLHYKFPFDEPKFNGADPDNDDGSGQTPFPSNSQMRDDRGDGKNVFGISLKTPVSSTISYQGPDISTAWGSLSDSECQTIRNWFSVMKDTNTNLVNLLDTLSNTYLGTTGSSRGSWDANEGCYTGGIFSGCATSENHEIWERYLEIVDLFMKDKFGLNYKMVTWSLPGSKTSGCYFEHNGKKYYDSAFTIYANDLAPFASSRLTNQDGTPKTRSWTDVLREYDYKTTHDATYPSRIDGNSSGMKMGQQLIMNANLSRPDALIYPTPRNLSYAVIKDEYPEGSLSGTKPLEVQMYDGGGSFKNTIETWRKQTANGIISGEVIDSFDTYSERMIFEGLLKYGRSAGIEFVTKAEAYDICFNHPIEAGNLIYNPQLRNTAKEFMPTATTVPTNPDGYTGSCEVSIDSDGVPVLDTNGAVAYDHYGIPLGKINYKASVKGNGTISFMLIKNNSFNSFTTIHTEAISSADAFRDISVDFIVPNNAITSGYDGRFGGYGDKVIAVRIEYSDGLFVKNIGLFKV